MSDTGKSEQLSSSGSGSAGGIDEGVDEGVIYPTEEEVLTLRRIAGQVPWSSYLIAFVELCERFSYYGSTVVFTNFIQQPMPEGSTTGAGMDGQSGALGYGQRAATGITTFNTFWAYVMPLLGGYLADTYWGRYKTITVSIFVALVGHILMIISAIPPVLEHPEGAMAIFIVALIIMGIGAGGFKANISPLIAEQYQGTKMVIKVLSTGERVIVDPTLTTSRIYMYFYMMINVGALAGQIGMVYCEKYVGFYLAFLLPTVMLCIAVPVVVFGRKKYVQSPPQGSVLGKALKLWALATKGRWSFNPRTTWRNMTDSSFWENVKPSNMIEAKKPKWMKEIDDQWVDQVARGFKACNVFLWYPLFWLTYNQLNNNLTSQAAVMNTHGLPNDILSNLNPIALIILIPVCDHFLYPALQRAGINFSPLKKITLGFITGSLAMVWACVIQYYLYERSECGKYAAECDTTVDINVWAQTGAYVLIAVSEIFASITGLEYAYTKAPKNMRSMVTAVFLFMNAVSSAIGEAFVSLSADPLLVWNYGTVAVLSFLGAIGFWASYYKYDREEEKMNNLEESKAMDKPVEVVSKGDNVV